MIIQDSDLKKISAEERAFYYWLLEAKAYGLVIDFEHQPKSFELSPKETIKQHKPMKRVDDKILDAHLLNPHKYTADYKIWFTEKALPFLADTYNLVRQNSKAVILVDSDLVAYVDTKGGFNANGSLREFSINQKWVYNIHRVFVNKIEMSISKKRVKHSFLGKTWVPEDIECDLVRTPAQRIYKKLHFTRKTVVEYLEEKLGMFQL